MFVDDMFPPPARTQQQTAQALYNQSLDLKQSGLIAGIDVLRAEVQLNAQTQRATAADHAPRATLLVTAVRRLESTQVEDELLQRVPLAHRQ